MTAAAVHGPYAGLVAEHGLAESHRLALAQVPAGARVLDVGCATGYLAAELRARGCEVVGVEVDPAAAAHARRHCAAVVVGDLESSPTRGEVERAVADGVDVVLCADVLEHLRDPWAVLAWLRTLLRDDAEAKAIISVPNIGHWTARRELLRGRFPYADFGLFDRTHLRFFTRDSARELAHRAGFAVRAELPAGAPLPLESRVPALARVRDPCVRRCPGLLALQFVLVLRAGHQPRP
jgi:methionine biosynthesis protein MetW